MSVADCYACGPFSSTHAAGFARLVLRQDSTTFTNSLQYKDRPCQVQRAKCFRSNERILSRSHEKTPLPILFLHSLDLRKLIRHLYKKKEEKDSPRKMCVMGGKVGQVE